MSEHDPRPCHDPALRYIYTIIAVPILYLVGQTIRSLGIMCGWW